ncbi:conserved hypothetical protein [Ricinus communis]|uniref:Uncharacterized protein n=1 Tax=Ricinus communis TaxID=3988 RepID=B9REM5_RICCO|nr:conserved hypothetical protein [Ricinus communis]
MRSHPPLLNSNPITIIIIRYIKAAVGCAPLTIEKQQRREVARKERDRDKDRETESEKRTLTNENEWQNGKATETDPTSHLKWTRPTLNLSTTF